MDLVSIPRISALLARHGDRGRSRLFTPEEIERCTGASCPDASFAARFAAKEAFFKAIGTGWGRGILWTEVSVVNSATGAPSLRLAGAAATAAADQGVQRLHLSLTHTDDLAAAYVVLEG